MAITVEQWQVLGAEIRAQAARRGITIERYLLENVCWVLDERTSPPTKQRFTANAVQQTFLDQFWFWNVCLKARQQGMCLDPATRILTADLRWLPIDEIEPGMEVVGVDEDFASHRNHRKMRTARVEAKAEIFDDALRFRMQDGRELVMSPGHRMLSFRGSRCEWIQARRLRIGDRLRFITEPWESTDIEDAWLGGIIDGEGHTRQKHRAGCEISISQVGGPVLDRIRAYVSSRGYTHRVEWDARLPGVSKMGRKIVGRVVISRMNELFRLIGQTRPVRFLSKRWWEGKELPGKNSGIGWSKIVAIEYAGRRRLIDLQTSTKTFIAEGFVSHNSTVTALLMFCFALANENFRAGIIDRTDQEAKKKLAKIKFAYDALHLTPLGAAFKQLLPLIAPSNDHTLTFANGSQIYAATSLRGGTLNFLWISELGTIAVKDPAKAEEIMGGSLEAVHPGNIAVIESTHEGGRFGENYRMIRLAQKSPPHPYLTNMQWKFHFFGWWQNPRYAVEPHPGRGLALTPELVNYFAELEKAIGRKLTDAQKNWYIQKSATQRDMARQYPGTAEEALRATTEGAIYADLINRLRSQGRVCDLVLAPECPLWTSWDLGMSDATGVWLLQVVGPDIHALDYHCANGATPGEHAAQVLRWEKTWGKPIAGHYLPHDALQAKASTTWYQELKKAGLRNIKVVPRIPDIWVGINQTRELLPRFRFNAQTCEKEFPQPGDRIWPSGLSALEGYRKKVEAVGGAEKSIPVHDECESGASSLRTFCEAHARGLLVGPSQLEQQGRRAAQGPQRAKMGLSRPGYEKREPLPRAIMR